MTVQEFSDLKETLVNKFNVEYLGERIEPEGAQEE